MREMQKKVKKKDSDRLSQALRANLLKRKQQERSRTTAKIDLQQKKTFYYQTDKGIFINIFLTPNAKSDAIQGLYHSPEDETYLKVSIKAIPQDDEANTSLIEFIATKLCLPKKNLILAKGEKNRFKTLLIQEYDVLILNEKLKSLILEKEKIFGTE